MVAIDFVHSGELRQASSWKNNESKAAWAAVHLCGREFRDGNAAIAGPVCTHCFVLKHFGCLHRLIIDLAVGR